MTRSLLIRPGEGMKRARERLTLLLACFMACRRAGYRAVAATRRQRGFTLLELTIAMTFVGLLASGIVISISTCLNVWTRSVESADLNQEARAVMEMVSRDLRGCYLGLVQTTGYFTGSPAKPGGVQFDTIEFTTQTSDLSRFALLPDEMRSQKQESRPPISDYVAVHYGWRTGQGVDGLYRTTWVSPGAMGEKRGGAESSELVSTALTSLRFRYFDGAEWDDSFDSSTRSNNPPIAVSVSLTLRDARGQEREFQTVVPIT